MAPPTLAHTFQHEGRYFELDLFLRDERTLFEGKLVQLELITAQEYVSTLMHYARVQKLPTGQAIETYRSWSEANNRPFLRPELIEAKLAYHSHAIFYVRPPEELVLLVPYSEQAFATHKAHCQDFFRLLKGEFFPDTLKYSPDENPLK